MNQQWIDFRELRERLNFEEVLRDYGVELKRKKADQLVGFCPLPNHNGKRKSPSFSVNLQRKCFNCFGCNRGGNCLDFVIYMEGKDPKNRQHVREVALLLQERFHFDSDPNPNPDRRASNPKHAEAGPNAPKSSRKPVELARGAQEKPSEGQARPVLVNAPLDFELRGLDPKHPYLRERGFSEHTILHFGLGFCNRGLMQGRVVIPLRDQAGKLIGYAGRLTRDDQVGDKVPKYLFPGDRERNGTKLEFRKSLFLYNGFSIKQPVRDLVVVEGFASVWWLTQCGFSDVVALMGSSCSEEQAFLIRSLVSPSGRVWLMPDAGEAGERCAESVLMQVAPHRFTHWVKLNEGQPTDVSPDDLMQLLEWKAEP